jgi:hypothetical protein
MAFPLMIVAPILEIVGKIFDRVIPDKAAAEKAKMEFMLTAQSQEFSLALEQIKVNTAEAASTNWFVAGWRPFIGWICGVALGYTYLILPFMQFLAYTFGTPELISQLSQLPTLALAELMPILLGMLGLGALRTIEKVKDTEGNR